MSKQQTKREIEMESDDRLFAFIRLLQKSGVVDDAAITDAKIRNAKRRKNRNAYHNTQLLLKHYRTIAWLLECFPEKIAEELERPFECVDKLFEQLDVEMSYGNKRLEERMENMKRTRMLIDRVNDALMVLKKKPNDGERLYELIYLTYVAPEVLTHNQLLFRLNISSRHYYRLRDQAYNIISLRLWSAPDRETDYWLEMLSFLEDFE